MKKSELLGALQAGDEKHNLSTFMHEEHKVVMTGCSFCRKHFGTVEQSNVTSQTMYFRRCWKSYLLKQNYQGVSSGLFLHFGEI